MGVGARRRACWQAGMWDAAQAHMWPDPHVWGAMRGGQRTVRNACTHAGACLSPCPGPRPRAARLPTPTPCMVHARGLLPHRPHGLLLAAAAPGTWHVAACPCDRSHDAARPRRPRRLPPPLTPNTSPRHAPGDEGTGHVVAHHLQHGRLDVLVGDALDVAVPHCGTRGGVGRDGLGGGQGDSRGRASGSGGGQRAGRGGPARSPCLSHICSGFDPME